MYYRRLVYHTILLYGESLYSLYIENYMDHREGISGDSLLRFVDILIRSI